MLTTIKNIITAIGALKGLLGLIQPITDLIHQVETPGVSGAQKKAAVMNLLKATLAAVKTALGISLPDDLILGFANDIIDVIVAVENALGRLTHSSTTPTAATPAASAPETRSPAPVAQTSTGAAKPAEPMFPPVQPPALVTKEFGD